MEPLWRLAWSRAASLLGRHVQVRPSIAWAGGGWSVVAAPGRRSTRPRALWRIFASSCATMTQRCVGVSQECVAARGSPAGPGAIGCRYWRHVLPALRPVPGLSAGKLGIHCAGPALPTGPGRSVTGIVTPRSSPREASGSPAGCPWCDITLDPPGPASGPVAGTDSHGPMDLPKKGLKQNG